MPDKETTLDGSAVGSNGLLTGSDVDKAALANAQKKQNALDGSSVGSNGIMTNDLDKAIQDATPKPANPV